MELLGSSLIILVIIVGSFIVGSIVGAVVFGREAKRDRDVARSSWDHSDSEDTDYQP